MPRESVALARVVRCRAKGTDADVVAAALEDARFDARQDSRYEDLADDVRGRAELTKWERVDQMLAATPAGTVYRPDTGVVVQAELAAEAAAAAEREAALCEVQRITAHAAVAVGDHRNVSRRPVAAAPNSPRTGTVIERHRIFAKILSV
ncbi:hypothetical protein [Streptomyces sp. NPDC126503]|uniref:hypothetical protein n=1 Tax=Streptomyces sp. NPDC126503 TaxID=3155315 RepID=UPI0033235096